MDFLTGAADIRVQFSNYNPPYLCEEDQEPKPDGSGDGDDWEDSDDE